MGLRLGELPERAGTTVGSGPAGRALLCGGRVGVSGPLTVH